MTQHEKNYAEATRLYRARAAARRATIMSDTLTDEMEREYYDTRNAWENSEAVASLSSEERTKTIETVLSELPPIKG